VTCLRRGIGAAGATADHDARIFSLATLLSSLLVYNSLGAIDEEAITVSAVQEGRCRQPHSTRPPPTHTHVQSLSFIANLTKHIQARARGGRE
jgi:hypothetical protein